MSGKNTNILRRKIEATATKQANASLQSSLVKNFEKATSKVFLDYLNLEVNATVFERTISTHTQTIEAMSSILFGIVDFDEVVGLTGCDAQFINTAIIQLAGGTTDPDASRAVTKTDAAIFRLVINKVLMQFFDLHDTSDITSGMRDYKLDKAPLAFLLSETNYAMLRVRISDKKNAEIGQIEVVIPLTCIDRISASEICGSIQHDRNIWQGSMNDVASHAPIELDTIVQRMEASLGDVLNLKTGDLLDLKDGSLKNLSLEAPTTSGPKTVFKGRLGALKSQKAFKIVHIPNCQNTFFDF